MNYKLLSYENMTLVQYTFVSTVVALVLVKVNIVKVQIKQQFIWNIRFGLLHLTFQNHGYFWLYSSNCQGCV